MTSARREKRLHPLEPAAAQELLARGAAAIDVRELHEHNAEHIPGDRAEPLSTLPPAIATGGKPAIFYCNSGRRTWVNSSRLAAGVKGRAYLLEGGLNAWKAAGLPVEGGDPAAVAGANLLSQMLATFKKD